MKDYSQLFRAQTLPDGKVIKIVELGKLDVPSGSIVGCDPVVMPERAPYTRRVKPGTYPIEAAIAVIPGGDERIAFAKLTFTDAPVVRWELAVVGTQDPATLSDGRFFGYSVDAGIGGFMDAEIRDRYVAMVARFENENAGKSYYDGFLDERMEATYQNTRSWLSLPVQGGGNVIMFSSGFGDGAFPSYFGIAENDEASCLITDFFVLDPSPM